MKNMILLLVILITGTVFNAEAGTDSSKSSHHHHPKHNMIIVGQADIFLSHIVYKVPHNYQVLIKVNLPEAALKTYLSAKELAPDNLMIFLLDSSDISQIEQANVLKGKLYSEDENGERSEISSTIEIGKDNFKIIFFNELPLDLNAKN